MIHYLISLMIFIPFIGALFQLFISQRQSRWIALFSSSLSSVFSFFLVFSMKFNVASLQVHESFPWVSSYAISYDMGLDGLNALMILLIALLFPILIAAEWQQKLGVRGMHGLFLILQMSLLGAVCAQDLFLQFFFWSISSLPFYFLVGIWGGSRRERAAFNSIVTASMGEALFFSALVLVYYSIEPHTFLLRELTVNGFSGKFLHFFGYDLSVAMVSFVLMSAGLALRIPIWPLHGWFTEFAEEAPASAFVALAAGVVPVSLSIFMRDCYLLFPEILSFSSKIMVGIGAVNLLMGGICAISQKGLKKLLAFICIGEVGLILIGICSLNPTSVVGAVLQQLVVGIELAGLGLFSGIISNRIGHSYFLSHNQKRTLGGIVTIAPVMAIMVGVVLVSFLSFPGSGGFVGHALILIGSYLHYPGIVALAGIGFLLATYYLFSMYRFIFFGETVVQVEQFQDLTLRERSYLLPLVSALLVIGFYPKPCIELIRPTILEFLSKMN